MALWDEIGLCRKTIFQAPIFFAHRTGNFLREVIVKGRRKETKKTTYWPYWQTPEVAQNKPPPQFELTIFRREDRRSNHCATGPLPPGAFLLSL